MLNFNDLEQIKKILRESKTIAVVGFSPKENRPSSMVGRYLMDAGYQVVPVNPGQSEIAGATCYPNLGAIPEKIDIVDIFRRPEAVLPIVRDAISIGAKIIWMQQGIVNQEAAKVARDAGLTVVMDRCLKIDHMNL